MSDRPASPAVPAGPPAGQPAGSPAEPHAGGSAAAPAGRARRTSGWWYLAVPGMLALGALVAGGVVLFALAAGGRAVADQPTIPAADTVVLEVGEPAELVVFTRYRVGVGSQPVGVPRVVVLDPAGGELPLDRPDPNQTWSDGEGELVAQGEFTTVRSGPHRVVVGPSSTDLVTGVVVAPDPLSGVLASLGWALGIVVVSLVAAVVVAVVVALGRRRPRGRGTQPEVGGR